MSFTLLKAINDRTLNKIVIIPAEPQHLSEAEALAASIVESMSADSFQITPSDYSKWLDVIVDVAEQEGVPIGRKTQFVDVALDRILDHDPKIDGLGSDDPEALKIKIANTLWQTYKASKAHSAVSSDVSKVINQAREEEEAFAAIASEDEALTHGRHVEVLIHDRWYPGMITQGRTSGGKYTVRIKLRDGNRDIQIGAENIRPEAHQDEEAESGFAQIWNASKGVENEEGGGDMSGSDTMACCPYPVGSLRASLWHDYNQPKKQAKNFSKPVYTGLEDEQITMSPDDVDPSTMFDDEEDFGRGVADQDGEIDHGGDESVDDIASRIAGDDFADTSFGDDVANGDIGDQGDLSTRLADLESRLDSLEQDTAGDEKGDDCVGDSCDDDELNVDYDSLGTDRLGNAGAIGVSVPAPSEDASEGNEDVDPFRQAITSPSDMLSQAVRAVEDEGASAWKSMVLPKNPHPKDSKAHKAWEKGMKSAAQSAFGFQQKPKDKVVKKPIRKK